MFIGQLKTKDNKVSAEYFTFNEALSGVNNIIDNSKEQIIEALILEGKEYLDSNFPDFESYKLIASVRTIR